MSDKTRAELKEQIKTLNHNYQVIREMHERGYQYSVGEIKRLQDELKCTRKALDVAKKWLMKIGYLNMSEHGLGSEKMMTDWCKTVALHGLKEIETALEQKDK